MSAVDYKSAQPVRSEADGIDARVQVKIVDKQNPGTQQMTVDADSNAHVEVHGNDPTGTDTVIRVSEDGATKVDGLYDASLNTKPSTAGVTAQTRNASYSDTRQVERPTAKRGTTNTDTVSLDVSLHDELGNAFSTTNPLPVTFTNEEAGTPVHDHDESGAVVTAGGTYSKTYTVAGTALTLKRIIASASGRFKMIVETGASGSPVRKYTMFNSASNPNCMVEVPKNFVVAVGDVVKVTFTNLDQDSFTVYTMIEGMLA